MNRGTIGVPTSSEYSTINNGHVMGTPTTFAQPIQSDAAAFQNPSLILPSIDAITDFISQNQHLQQAQEQRQQHIDRQHENRQMTQFITNAVATPQSVPVSSNMPQARQPSVVSTRHDLHYHHHHQQQQQHHTHLSSSTSLSPAEIVAQQTKALLASGAHKAIVSVQQQHFSQSQMEPITSTITSRKSSTTSNNSKTGAHDGQHPVSHSNIVYPNSTSTDQCNRANESSDCAGPEPARKAQRKSKSATRAAVSIEPAMNASSSSQSGSAGAGSKELRPSSKCEHRKMRNLCLECKKAGTGGQSLCHHEKRRSQVGVAFNSRFCQQKINVGMVLHSASNAMTKVQGDPSFANIGDRNTLVER
jgi:hypothetical protein